LHDVQNVTPEPSELITSIKADILVLAALEDSVTDTNVADVQADIIVELANGPISSSAEKQLLGRGVTILPDVIANAGGVIVSYLEWKQNKENKHWSEAEVNERLAEILTPASEAMLERAAAKNLSLKQAAFELAVERIAQA
jgi:glutamate dehydrogenase (NADP+)